MLNRKLKQKTLARIERLSVDKGSCRIWTGYALPNPRNKNIRYGVIEVSNKGVVTRYSVRRLVYELNGNTPLLGNKTVTSICGNCLCINPSHLIKSETKKSNGPARK